MPETEINTMVVAPRGLDLSKVQIYVALAAKEKDIKTV